MITSSQIYWITRLDSIDLFLRSASWVLIASFSLISLVRFLMDVEPISAKGNTELRTILNRVCFISLPLFVLFSVLATLTPTTKEGIAIYTVPTIVNNEQVQKLPVNILKLANSQISEWLEALGVEVPE